MTTNLTVIELEARETSWEVAPGVTIAGYGYNGQVPGPVIEAKQGVPLEIRFTNRLPEPNLIHWHGLRIPAAMDGTQMVQTPVQPGETFTYRFTPPDAGTFWYHPHANETEQLEKGLYGALVVRGADEPIVDGEQVLVLDDVRLDRQNRLAKFGGFRERHDGREVVRHDELDLAILDDRFKAAVAAYFLFRERLSRLQIAGVATIVVGVTVLTALQAA